MKTRRILCCSLVIMLLFGGITSYSGENIKLPKPKIRGQLMKALKNRTSIKGFSTRELPDKVLSDLLWAAFGINNQRTGRRTAPSAFNSQEIDIYVLTADGSFLYNPVEHSLELVADGDIRGLVATQGYAKNAPVHFLYVADYDKARKRFSRSFIQEMEKWAMMHAGFIGQNVHLYCSAKGLAAVVRSFGNEEQLRKELRLRDSQGMIITQAVGYPPK